MKLALMIFTILAAGTSSFAKRPPHMDLEMTGFEYEALVAQEQQDKIANLQTPLLTHIFDDIFATGKRNLDWIRLLNKNRADHISLSTPETQQGFPIDDPRAYNPEIIRSAYNDLKKDMPESLRNIIFGSTPLPTQLPCPVEEYIQWGLKVDRVYQIANRWRTYEPYMDYLRTNSSNDIRGYYFITKTPGLLESLKNWGSIPQNQQEQVTIWLTQVCNNNLQDRQRCQSLVRRAIQNNQAFNFFNEHKNAGAQIIREMMDIPRSGRFSSVQWNGSNTVEVPFIDPQDQTMRAYLSDNIQGEWKLFPFALHVLFVDSNRYGVNVIWSPGVTPHVPSLGANTIYMDANAPISEYDVQWTIRHEFGHVLGFPDCYVEFYDMDLKAIVSYQLDTTDLMCSRRGHLKERHVEEMKRVYR